METKWCNDCKQSKHFSEFPKNPSMSDGLHRFCNACMAARMRAWYAKNRAGQRAKRQQREQHPQKRCELCLEILPTTFEFFQRQGQTEDGLDRICRSCAAAERAKKRPAELARQRARYEEKRRRVLSHYSGSLQPFCACCGESEYAFLAIDHVDGGGRRHYEQISASQICHVLIRDGFPPGYRVLCHNCNHARGMHGICPHEREWTSLLAQIVETL